jgi:hypothetical protein
VVADQLVQLYSVGLFLLYCILFGVGFVTISSLVVTK